MSPLTERLIAGFTPGESRPGLGNVERRRAAVAVLLHDEPAGPRVLLMKRAERPGDPWSGHISLPGGRHERFDADLHATAIRETREEVGVELSGARFLGQLTALMPATSGPNGIEVTPFVFLTEVAVEPTCGPEALSAFWLPLETAAAGAFDTTYTYPDSGLTFPSWTYDGHVIWGLTRRIIDDVLAKAKRR